MKARDLLVLAAPLANSGCISLDFMWFHNEPLDAYSHEWAPSEGEAGEPHAPNHVPEACIEEVPLLTADGLTVYGLWAWRDEAFLAGDESQPCGSRRAPLTVVYYHGQTLHLDYYWERVQLLWDAGLTVFAVDYRGYGKSEGEPDEAGMYEDSRTALRSTRCRLAASAECLADTPLPSAKGAGIFLYGFSLGAAAATQVATEVLPAGLVLEGAFTSAQGFVDDIGQLGVPASALLVYEFDNLGRIPAIDAPKLLIHGIDDDSVRFEHSRILYDAALECEDAEEGAPSCKDLWAVPGAGHGDIPEVAGEEYLERVRGFVETWGG